MCRNKFRVPEEIEKRKYVGEESEPDGARWKKRYYRVYCPHCGDFTDHVKAKGNRWRCEKCGRVHS